MTESYIQATQMMSESVVKSEGTTTSELRQSIEIYTAALSAHSAQADAIAATLPTELLTYLKKIALYAYKVTDKDIEALRSAGYSEDALFEITVSGALGAGMTRLQHGLQALKGEA